MAYYWPFVDEFNPIRQGQSNRYKLDMAFRDQLTSLKSYWESAELKAKSKPSDGFFLVQELRNTGKIKHYSEKFIRDYTKTIGKIAESIKQPIRYAGEAGTNWAVFERWNKPENYEKPLVILPGTKKSDTCIFINSELWDIFIKSSLWIEALCIHEWCLFTENINKGQSDIDRGKIYMLLTDRPDNRRPLAWERNAVDILIMEGVSFHCPWTGKSIGESAKYDLDHIIPVSIYPTNEIWNLIPSNSNYNKHVKRDRVPKKEKLEKSRIYIEEAYNNYFKSDVLRTVLLLDVRFRFGEKINEPKEISYRAIDFVDKVAELRNIARF